MRTNIGRSLTDFFGATVPKFDAKKSVGLLPNATTTKLRKKEGDRGAKN